MAFAGQFGQLLEHLEAIYRTLITLRPEGYSVREGKVLAGDVEAFQVRTAVWIDVA